MFGLGIRYLNGWAMAAADGAKKEKAEWPPHPDRIFIALAAAWFETGKDSGEGEALRWLEKFGSPSIAASDSTTRVLTTSYVPSNDDASPMSIKYKKGVRIEKPHAVIGTFTLGRDRQPRTFPTAIPIDPNVYLMWEEEPPELYQSSLANLCRKVVCVGHPASLVQMWIEHSPPPPTLVPQKGITRLRLRVFGPGRLDYLAQKCGREDHIAKVDAIWEREQLAKKSSEAGKLKRVREAHLHGIVERLRPDPGHFEGYDSPTTKSVGPKFRGTVFDPRMVIVTLSGKRMPLSSTLRITQALRGSLMSGVPQPVPEWLSGHTPEGGRSEKPHLALLPLPFVGREHADGRIMGFAIAVPKDVSFGEATRVLATWLRDDHGIVRPHVLFDGRWFECAMELETRETPPFSLRSEIWTRYSLAWATVTPLVLDRHFDGDDKWELAAENVKDSCERIGLPRPHSVLLHPVSMFEGVPRSNEFPRMKRKKDGGWMHHSHAVILFKEAIEGPVILGAGRYRGYGFCRPLAQ